MEQNIEFFRLVTGEDIVSECEIHDDYYRLINPCKVVYTSSRKDGFLSISLMQWIFSKICEDQVFELPKDQVLIKSKPNEKMIEHYYSSVEHFLQSEPKDDMIFDDPMSSDFEEESISNSEALSLLDELLKNTKKGNLH